MTGILAIYAAVTAASTLVIGYLIADGLSAGKQSCPVRMHDRRRRRR